MRVTDASALVMVLSATTAQASALRARLRAEALAAPHVVDLEVTNALRRHVRGGRLSPVDAQNALHELQVFSIERHAHGPLLGRCWELRENVTPYDAAYVALAETLGVPLLTGDARLAHARGLRCEVELVT